MTDAAVAQLLQSAAPGQFDAIVAQLGPLMMGSGGGGGGSSVDVTSLKHEWQLSQGIGNTNDSNKAVMASNPLAAELQPKLLNYHQKTFSGRRESGLDSKKVTARVWLLPTSSSSKFQLVSYAEKMDGQNMQAGHWKSVWTITNTSGAEAHVEGRIDIHTHSYEEGNTQLQFSKTFDGDEIVEEVETENDGLSLANGVLFRIIQCEHEVLSILKGLHDLSVDSLKQIRRVLPITKTKMNWEVEAQRGVKHLKKTAKR
jgi:hypothetical protein